MFGCHHFSVIVQLLPSEIMAVKAVIESVIEKVIMLVKSGSQKKSSQSFTLLSNYLG